MKQKDLDIGGDFFYDRSMKADAAVMHPPASILANLEVRPIIREERQRWDALMRAHHYLGFTALVGESRR